MLYNTKICLYLLMMLIALSLLFGLCGCEGPSEGASDHQSASDTFHEIETGEPETVRETVAETKTPETVRETVAETKTPETVRETVAETKTPETVSPDSEFGAPFGEGFTIAMSAPAYPANIDRVEITMTGTVKGKRFEYQTLCHVGRIENGEVTWLGESGYEVAAKSPMPAPDAYAEDFIYVNLDQIRINRGYEFLPGDYCIIYHGQTVYFELTEPQ